MVITKWKFIKSLFYAHFSNLSIHLASQRSCVAVLLQLRHKFYHSLPDAKRRPRFETSAISVCC